MKIALIAPGLIQIPPDNYGATEIILWNYKCYLERYGHSADIYNTKNIKSAMGIINGTPYDFIHLHCRGHLKFFNSKFKKPWCFSAHGWGLSCDEFQAPGIIALSDGEAGMRNKFGYRGFLRILRNGVEFERFRFQPEGNGRSICLGRIEGRKRQSWLSRLLKDKVPLDFVGPLADPLFKENRTCRYLDIWDKPYLYEHLTDYNCLVLLSKQEAAPLVVPEALAAGLSVVVSEAASANLESRPFISILPNNCEDINIILSAINKQIIQNSAYREEIREYAKERFDLERIIQEYIEIIKDFNSQPRKKQFTII